MMTKAEKRRIVQDLRKDVITFKNSAADIEKELANIEKMPVYEDSLEGKIEAAETSAQAEINKIMEKLSTMTGKRYHYNTIVPLKSEPEVDVNLNVCLGCSEDFPMDEVYNPHGSAQTDAVEELVKFCRKHKWQSEAVMKNWIIKKVINT